MRGCASVGFGVVGLRQEIVLTKKQSPGSQAICGGLLQHEFHRRHLRVLADDARGQLIGRRAEPHFHAGLRAVPSVHAAEPHGRSARMIADAVAESVGLQVGEPRDTVRSSRTGASGLQAWRQLVIRRRRWWDSIGPE